MRTQEQIDEIVSTVLSLPLHRNLGLRLRREGDPTSGLALVVDEATRNPGGRVTEAALEAIVLGTHLLNVKRVLVVPHTRCAVASNSEETLRERVAASAGVDATWQHFHVIEDQVATLGLDVHRVRSHPLVPASTEVGGFIYDVDTGLLEQKY